MTVQRAKGAKKTVCVPSGYRYEFEGKRNWATSSDELWEHAVGDEECGILLGIRRIDGSRCAVVKLPRNRIVAVIDFYIKPVQKA